MFHVPPTQVDTGLMGRARSLVVGAVIRLCTAGSPVFQFVFRNNEE